MTDYREARRMMESLTELAQEQGEARCSEAFQAQLATLSRHRATLGPAEERAAMLQFREALTPVIHQSDFGRYVYEKPRGYPGDFGTQEMIWLAHAVGGAHRYCGSTPLGRLLSALSFDMAASRATAHRVSRLKDYVRDAGPRIASIGCGSAIELWDMADYRSAPAEVFLLDQDTGALERAMTQIGGADFISVTCHRANVLKFVLAPTQSGLPPQDLVYLFGLLDYFPLSSAARIVKSAWSLVAPGGRLVLTNAMPSNPDRLWMEWGGDWWLDHKEADAIASLARPLEGFRRASVQADPFGVYAYLEVEKE